MNHDHDPNAEASHHLLHLQILRQHKNKWHVWPDWIRSLLTGLLLHGLGKFVCWTIVFITKGLSYLASNHSNVTLPCLLCFSERPCEKTRTIQHVVVLRATAGIAHTVSTTGPCKIQQQQRPCEEYWSTNSNDAPPALLSTTTNYIIIL